MESTPIVFGFNVADYVIFISLLVLSTLIGIYYGFVAKKKQDNTAEYLFGGKEMTLIPIAISLIVQHISGITMLGIPTEIYAYGTQYWLSIIAALTLPISVLYIFYPVFYDLQLVSTFMYLERRYNRSVRLVAAACFLFGSTVFLPIFIYIPALALNQVSGISIHVVATITTILCIFYTTVGGLRAVVLTDALQFVSMSGAVLVVIILGLLKMENPWDLLNIADRGERLIIFDLDPSPFVRQSVWTILFGLSTYWCADFGCAQTCIQKLMSVPDKKTAIRAVWIFTFGVILFNITGMITGLVMYANLKDCDPFTAGLVQKLDQILPYFILEIREYMPGITGLFVAGLFSGGLSSMSGMMNTMSCILYEDFLKSRYPNCSEKTASNLLKGLVIVVGIITLALVFIVERMTTVFELTLTLYGVTGGAVFGLFTTGMLCRHFNTKGAIYGAIVSVILVGTITIGAQSLSTPETLPLNTDGCGPITNSSFYKLSELDGSSLTTKANLYFSIHTLNTTSNTSFHSVSTRQSEDVFWPFRISYMYYTLIGCLTVWIVGLPISLFTKSDGIFEEDLLAPFMRRNRI